MNDIPQDLPGLLTVLMGGSGVLFGLISVWIIDRVIEFWQQRNGGQPVSGTKRRWISIFVPVSLVLLGYGGLLLLGVVPLTQQTAYLAAVNAVASAGSKQVLYAAIASSEKPTVTNNIGTVSSESGDVYLGSSHNEEKPRG